MEFYYVHGNVIVTSNRPIFATNLVNISILLSRFLLAPVDTLSTTSSEAAAFKISICAFVQCLFVLWSAFLQKSVLLL